MRKSFGIEKNREILSGSAKFGKAGLQRDLSLQELCLRWYMLFGYVSN